MVPAYTKFGNFHLYTIETGWFRMDGGAIFGVVPKPLWSKRIRPDEQNRLLLTSRCLLVHSIITNRRYIIDCGVGHKFDTKHTAMYNIDFSRFSLQDSLRAHSINPKDITDVIFTHLHFDHCGGAVSLTPLGDRQLTFPNARHWVHSNQWENAIKPNVREKASYLPDNIEPLSASGTVQLTEDGDEFEAGFSTWTVNGHTPGQILPVLKDNDRELVFMADLLPTVHHLPLPWVMGYDTRPLETLEEKVRFFDHCIHSGTYMFLEHDIQNELIRIEGDPQRPAVLWTGTLADL